MEQRQKKIIVNTLITIAVLITLACFVILMLSIDTIPEKWADYVGYVGTFAPTIIGIIVKVYLSFIIRKQNIKAIDNHLVESGVKPLSEIKQSNKSTKNELKDYFHYKDYHFKVSKTKIVITFNEKDEENNYKELKVALGEFIEKVRKDLGSQLI